MTTTSKGGSSLLSGRPSRQGTFRGTRPAIALRIATLNPSRSKPVETALNAPESASFEHLVRQIRDKETFGVGTIFVNDGPIHDVHIARNSGRTVKS